MKTLTAVLVLSVITTGFALRAFADDKGANKVDERVFELRTYYAADGKMDALHARFRDHTCKLFEKHGITIVGFWSPTKPEEASKKLIYMLAYPNKAEASKRWQAFITDPDWKAAQAASERNGKLVDKVEHVFLNATGYSPMK